MKTSLKVSSALKSRRASDSVPAPSASNALTDQTYDYGSGNQTYDVSGDFSNATDGTWSVSGAGATISTSGVVTIPTSSFRNSVTITATYTNDSGTANSAFSVDVGKVVSTDAEFHDAFFEDSALDGGILILDDASFTTLLVPDLEFVTETVVKITSGASITTLYNTTGANVQTAGLVSLAGTVVTLSGTDLATDTAPGEITAFGGDDVIVQNAAATVSTDYIIAFYVSANPNNRGVFVTNVGGFPNQFGIDASPGFHTVSVTAEDTAVNDVLRAGAGSPDNTGLVVPFASLRAIVSTPATHYVSTTGTDSGVSSLASPYATPSYALAQAVAGDTIIMRPGVYAPFSITKSGSAGSPITFTTLPGEERQAIIRGDLADHTCYNGNFPTYNAGTDPFLENGTAITEDTSKRDGIVIDSQDYIDIKNLKIEQVYRNPVFVRGTNGERHGNINITGNHIEYCGDAGIFVGGKARFNDLIASSLTGAGDQPIHTVHIWENAVTKTNVATDFNGTDDLGRRGGANECVTVGNGVEGCIVELNDIYDSNQYGVDFKSGVRDSRINDNRVWGMEKYVLYLDAGERFITNVDIYNNICWDSQTGITTSREEDNDDDAGIALTDINIYNNILFDINGIGLFAYKHPKDNQDTGSIVNNVWAFNTVYNAARTFQFGSTYFNDVSLSSYTGFSSATLSGNQFVGNIIHSDKAIRINDGWTADNDAQFLVDDNLNFSAGTPTDPKFVDPDVTVVIGSGHRPTITLPDFSLQSDSPALGTVASTYTGSPLNEDREGTTRGDPADAGALEYVG